MKIIDILEAQLQQLGSKKVTKKTHPETIRWGNKYIVYESLSKRPGLYIFLGAAGAVRTGSSPAFSSSAPFLKEKLLARHAAQEAKKPKVKTPKQYATAADIDL